MRRLRSIRRAEGRTVLVLLAFVFFVQSVLSTGKVLQLSVFLDAYGQEALALAFFLSAGIVILVSAGYAALTRAVRPGVLVPSMLAVLAAGFVAWRLGFGPPQRDFPLLLLEAPEGILDPFGPFVLYVWVEVASSIAVVQGWAWVNDAFDPRQAKRLIPLVGLGASVSFLVNGLLVQPLVGRLIEADDLTWIVAASLLLAIGCFFLSRRRGLAEPPPAAGEAARPALSGVPGFLAGLREGFPQILRSPLLSLLAFVTVATIVSQGLLDYLFMNALRERLGKNELAVFYAAFIAALGVGQIGLQLLASGRLLVRFGAAVVILASPAVLILGGALFLLVPLFWVLVGLRFADRLFKQAFYSPSLQALYTPVPSGEKRQAMMLIKGVLSPAAYGLFGLLMLLGGTRLSPRTLVALLIGLAAVTGLVLLVRGRDAYAEALKRTMRRRGAEPGVAIEDFAEALDWETIGAVQRIVFDEGDPRRAVLGLHLLAGSTAPQVRALVNRAARMHPSAAVRREASRLIAERGWPMDAARILSLLRTEAEPTVIRQHLLTVAALRGEWGADAVTARLADPDPRVRAAAAVASLRLGAADAEARAEAEALGRGGAPGRLALAEALALGGEPEDAPRLAPLLVDPDRAVRSEALRAAARLRAAELLPTLLAAFRVSGPREEAGAALVALGPAAAAPLAELALDPETDPGLRRLAIRCLGQVDTPRAGGALEALLASRDHAIRHAAGAALGRLARSATRYAGPSKVTVLARVFNEVRVAYLLRALIAGLGEAGDGPGRALILRELSLRLRASEDHVFGLLALADPHRSVALVRENLRHGTQKQRVHALELLEVSFSHYEAVVLVGFLQADADPVNIERVMPEAWPRLRRAREDPIGALLAGKDEGLRALVRSAEPDRRPGTNGGAGAAPERAQPWLSAALRLGSIPGFDGLPLADLGELCRAAEEVPYPRGGEVLRPGAPRDALYVVLEGEVTLSGDGGPSAPLGPGSLLGAEVLSGAGSIQRAARAAPGACLLRLDADALAAGLCTSGPLTRALLRLLST